MTSSAVHFSTEPGEEPTTPGRFVDTAAIEPLEMLPGLTFQPVLGERSMVNVVSFEPHSEAPMHVHAEEQIVVVVEGEFEFTIDGETRTMRPGDVAVVPPWVSHGARTGDTHCREFDVFTPPRATLLEHARAVQVATDGSPAAHGDR